ncbi:Hypothetical predicted protein [Olea europaea subsp. europaea]|uniref:Uncharacterized protein n=1 Tax=Olea europaea subsp. europaea TaxID=158383 RepID=A0A8S0UNJ6_OLEEU|nr:Hypothetical predicted protein [Olea europaea subsp. europaea]
MSLVTSDMSGADLLLPSFDSISFAEHHEQWDDVAKVTSRASGFDHIYGADPSRERVDEGRETIKFESSDSVQIAEPTTTQRDNEKRVRLNPDLGKQKQQKKKEEVPKEMGRLVRIREELIRSCPIGNDDENYNAIGKSIPELFKSIETKLEEGVPNNQHEINCQEEVDNFGASIDNRCSDLGTSPDSVVINSVPEPPIFEKGAEDNVEMNPSSGLLVAYDSFKSQSSETLFPKKLPKISRAKERSKQTSRMLDLSKKPNASKNKGNQNKSVGKHKVKEKGDTSCALIETESHLAEGITTSFFV